jgi:hypothetical protein
VGITWRRARELPEILRLTNHDCSQEYQNPRLIWSPSRLVVEARIYDESGIDLSSGGTLLGDWRNARSRCEELLTAELQRSEPGRCGRRLEVVPDRAA